MTSNKANDKQKTSCDGACLRMAGQKMYAKKNQNKAEKWTERIYFLKIPRYNMLKFSDSGEIPQQ